MDILCQAKSGMGKTAVFVLATLQQIEMVDGEVDKFSFMKLLTTFRIAIFECELIFEVWCYQS